MRLFIGCAGWNLPKDGIGTFQAIGTHLERYASEFNSVEINSSFYRPHRVATYQRWAASTPSNFRFAVKLPRQITHIRRLIDVEAELAQFLHETSGLGMKLGAFLVQLPPSLEFDLAITEQFFRSLRARTDIPIVCEPRNATWFAANVEGLLAQLTIDRVAADPSIVPGAADPGGMGMNLYFRWHGTPRMYYSAYDEQALQALANRLCKQTRRFHTAWCIFDNTALGAAVKNALAFREIVKFGDLREAFK